MIVFEWLGGVIVGLLTVALIIAVLVIGWLAIIGTMMLMLELMYLASLIDRGIKRIRRGQIGFPGPKTCIAGFLAFCVLSFVNAELDHEGHFKSCAAAHLAHVDSFDEVPAQYVKTLRTIPRACQKYERAVALRVWLGYEVPRPSYGFRI